MQANSRVECIKSFNPYDLPEMYQGPIPQKGSIYIVESVEPCPCGCHAILNLIGFPRATFDCRHFREVLPFGDIDELIDNILKDEVSPFVHEMTSNKWN